MCLMLQNNFWFFGLPLQKRWWHWHQSWLCRLQELHNGAAPGSFLLQPGSLSHQEWVFRVHSGLALQIQIKWACLEVIFFFFSQASVGMLLRLLSYLSLRSWVLLQSATGSPPGIFLINIFSISLKPRILGWFPPPFPHSHCILPPPAPLSPLPMEDILWLQERSHRGLEPRNSCNPEPLSERSQGWIQLTRGSAANPLGLHMCLFKCQWPTQAEYLLAATCLKSKAELQFIFIVQSTDPSTVVISVPSYLWNYSGSSEKLTSTLAVFLYCQGIISVCNKYIGKGFQKQNKTGTTYCMWKLY